MVETVQQETNQEVETQQIQQQQEQQAQEAVAAQKKLLLGNSRCVTDFAKVQQIGTGTYGVVFLAKDKRTGK